MFPLNILVILQNLRTDTTGRNDPYNIKTGFIASKTVNLKGYFRFIARVRRMC